MIFAARKVTLFPMQFNRYDTKVTVIFPKDSRRHFTSKLKTDETEQISNNIQRIWIGILNRSLTEEIAIKKDKPLGFFILDSKGRINIKHATTETKKKATAKIYIKKRQGGGFLNRYDFAYTGRDTVNQLGKIPPGIIKNACSENNNIAQKKINQIIRQGGQEVELIFPNILRGAIKDVFQTPFRLLGNFGKQELQKFKTKIL